MARLVEANVRFTRADIAGQNTLLVLVYVRPNGNGDDPNLVRQQLSQSIRSRLSGQFNVTPLVDVTILDG